MNNRRKVLCITIASILLGLLAPGNMRAQEITNLHPSGVVPVSVLTASGDYNWPGSEIEISQYIGPQVLDVNIGFGFDIVDPKMLYQIQFETPAAVNGFIGIGSTVSGNWNWRDPGLRPDSNRNPGETTWRPRMNTGKRN